jgi:hypothetical protein
MPQKQDFITPIHSNADNETREVETWNRSRVEHYNKGHPDNLAVTVL